MRIEFDIDPDIRGESRTRGVDPAIAALAGRQHGVVARGQLEAVGLARRAIEHRLETGRLHLVHRGAYAVGHRNITGKGWYMAAVLAIGADADLSHRSAGDLWAIRRTSRRRVDVTAPRRIDSRREIETHFAVLPPDETTVLDGIPVTTVPRTLFDLASVLTLHELERAFEQSEALRLTDPLSVEDILNRYPGRPGTRNLRQVLGQDLRGITRSELEERFLVLLDEAGLPRPHLNATIALNGTHFEVDCLWRKQRLIVELDSRSWHDTGRALDRDSERDRRLQAAGFRVVRITWTQLTQDPAGVARDLAKLLTP